MHEFKRITACLMSLLVLMVCFAGCMSSDQPDPTTDPVLSTTNGTESTEPSTTADTEPTGTLSQPIVEPTLPSGFFTGGDAPLEQVRLPGYDSGWVDGFVNQFGAFTTVNDTAQLSDVLSSIAQLGKDVTLPEGYDDAFFAENRLLVIPMQSGSGSVRYQAETEFDGELITVTLTGQMPEYGTMDMADWLILIPLDRSEYPAGYQIDLLAPQPNTREDLELQDR